jgi:hypothetical protein
MAESNPVTQRIVPPALMPRHATKALTQYHDGIALDCTHMTRCLTTPLVRQYLYRQQVAVNNVSGCPKQWAVLGSLLD